MRGDAASTDLPVESPLRPVRPFLNVGTAVGAFPAAIRGERTAHFAVRGGAWQPWYSALFLLLWLGWGVAAVVFCQFESGEGFSSLFQVKSAAAVRTRPISLACI